MTVEQLVDAARQADPRGYSEDTLLSMYKGSRRLQLRAMAAMIHAVGARPDEFPEFRLAQVQHLLNDDLQGTEEALANLDRLGVDRQLPLTDADIRAIPIRGRTDTIRDGEGKARKVKSRRRRSA